MIDISMYSLFSLVPLLRISLDLGRILTRFGTILTRFLARN